MPQEPKKRHSTQRQGKRRAAIKLFVPQGVSCKNCGSTILPHRVCKTCGYYNGRQILAIKKRKENENSKRPKA